MVGSTIQKEERITEMDIEKYQEYREYNCLTPAVKVMLHSRIEHCILHLPEELISFFEIQHTLDKNTSDSKVKYVSDCLLKLIVLGLIRAEEFGNDFDDLQDMALTKMLRKL
jgi:hypothetical protein